MTEEKLKEVLIKLITQNQGIKGTTLMVETCAAYYAGVVRGPKCDPELTLTLPKLLEDLVSEGKIMEIAYSLPSMPDREKAFYLPIDTRIHSVRNAI